MCLFFKITAPNVRPIVIVSPSWADLCAICDKVSNQEETYITEISLWELIKYMINNTK